MQATLFTTLAVLTSLLASCVWSAPDPDNSAEVFAPSSGAVLPVPGSIAVNDSAGIDSIPVTRASLSAASIKADDTLTSKTTDTDTNTDTNTSAEANAEANANANAKAKATTATKADANASVRMEYKSLNSRDPYLPGQVDFINGLLRFSKTVTVLNEVEEGPLFDPDTQEIWMPGSFADVIESYFGEEDAPVADVYLHTLVHEVGHVLFSQYDLPLLAREEDAADALASVLLLEYVENGAEVVLNAADMFGLESEDSVVLEESDFWSEHSLDIQRYYTTLCHVYGSDPDTHVDLVDDEFGLSQERAENCEYEYERIRQGWLDVLRPYLKR